jgi:hypothetical protein
MRTGLSAFLTAKVEELRLETEEELPASGQNAGLEATLGSAIEEHSSRVTEAGPEPTSPP